MRNIIMIMKKYSARLLLVYTISSFSMDTIVPLKDDVALMGNLIDQKILNTDKKSWFIPSMGCCLNFSTSFSPITRAQAITELETIGSIIQQTNHTQPHNEVIEKLYRDHHYFPQLINIMVQDQVEQLRNVTSMTLDTLCDPQAKIFNLPREISVFIHHKAHKSYEKKYLNRQDTTYINFRRDFYSLGEEEIHVMPLKKGNHVPCRLAICDHGKYLKVFDSFDNAVIWDIEGKEMDEVPSGTLITQNICCQNHNHKMIDNNLMVTCGYSDYPYGSETIYGYFKKHKIIPAMVVIRPTVISWLCQQLFLQNKENATALIKLRDSQAVARLQGVPKIMLLRFIKVALTKLEQGNQEG